jgi:hypothetical protein
MQNGIISIEMKALNFWNSLSPMGRVEMMKSNSVLGKSPKKAFNTCINYIITNNLY